MSRAALTVIVIVALGPLFVASRLISAANSSGVALTGQVSSEKEGPMEGVVMGAKKDGSTITIDVVSDDKGRYSFASSKMEPGHYSVKIRAIGYDLDGPASVEIAPGKTATADIKLRPAKNLAAQSMSTDRIVRLNPKNGEATEYLLPRETNIRRVFVDDSTTPVTFWVGSNHGASIIKLEPLD
jgi:hypothetical protein